MMPAGAGRPENRARSVGISSALQGSLEPNLCIGLLLRFNPTWGERQYADSLFTIRQGRRPATFRLHHRKSPGKAWHLRQRYAAFGTRWYKVWYVRQTLGENTYLFCCILVA